MLFFYRFWSVKLNNVLNEKTQVLINIRYIGRVCQHIQPSPRYVTIRSLIIIIRGTGVVVSLITRGIYALVFLIIRKISSPALLIY